MYRLLILFAVVLTAIVIATPPAHAGSGNGYGYAWFRDNDGDGIPNGQDDDWIPPEDGTGYKNRHGLGFVLPVAFCPAGPIGNVFQYGYQFRFREMKNGGEPAGDLLRIRLRLRDGTCR